MRYWKVNNHWWASEWIPIANLAIADVALVIRWLEGTTAWDRKDTRRG
jgi:hypothetical protein